MGAQTFPIKGGGGEGMTKNSKERKEFELPGCTISVTVTGGGLPPLKLDLNSSRKITRASLDEKISQTLDNLERWQKEDKRKEKGTSEVAK